MSEKDLNYMQIAEIVSKRSHCIKRKVGAIITSPDGYILSTGYNGPVKKSDHCDQNNFCLRDNMGVGENLDLCIGSHAELNAIIQCAVHGTKIPEGSSIYCTDYPCSFCMRSLINAGITKIFYKRDYPNPVYTMLGDRFESIIKIG